LHTALIDRAVAAGILSLAGFIFGGARADLPGTAVAAAAEPRPQLVLAYSGFRIGTDLTPAFVLFDDGLLIYRDEAANQMSRAGRWMSVRVDATERNKLVADAYESLLGRTRCVMPLSYIDAAIPTFYVERDGREIVRRVRGLKAGDRAPDFTDCEAIFDVARRLASFTDERARPAADVESLLPGRLFWEQKTRAADGE
jgi:hypothetical protein